MEGGRRAATSLYARCLAALARRARPSAAHLPDPVLLDLYSAMFTEKAELLIPEFSNLDIFYRILKTNHCRLSILKYFQAVVQLGINLSNKLSTAYVNRCSKFKILENGNVAGRDTLIDLGLRLGGFLNDAGWYAEAEYVLLSCRDLCQTSTSINSHKITLECCHRLLHAQSSYRNFVNARVTYDLSFRVLDSTFETSHLKSIGLQRETISKAELSSNYLQYYIKDEPENCNVEKALKATHNCKDCDNTIGNDSNNLLLRLFKEYAVYHFLRSDYKDTYKWSMKALELLKPETPVKIIIDVLCICGKSCIMMRKFQRAEILIQQAVVRARSYYGKLNPKYAFCLLDYGFYFLNVDNILNSVTVYEEALGVLKRVYHGNNLHVAIAHEDLSYALYVHEYSSGRFYKARGHVDKAIQIMENLLPPDHLMLATTKRVKALILEEIALDTLPFENSGDLLAESERLHKSALELSLNAFGEKNVQTAKQYGNLGRLYQSMKKFKEAQNMQLRAIEIKEEILGPKDYEVGLSLGHLASLYNYHMKLFLDAEELYYRSIRISLESFGEEYSGLEYDYIGLVHVNTELRRPDRAAFYTQLLHQWRRRREISAEEHHLDFGQEVEMPIYDVQSEVFGYDDPPSDIS